MSADQPEPLHDSRGYSDLPAQQHRKATPVMRNAVVRRIGRQLRRLILPLVGYWEVRLALDAMQQEIEQVKQIVRHRRDDGSMVGLVAREVDRLDSYLVHHAAALLAEIRTQADSIRLVAQQVDRLDSYLVHHAAALLAEIRTQADSIRRIEPPLYVSPELQVILRMQNAYDVIVPSQETGLLTYLVHQGIEAIEPGVRSILANRLRPGAIAIDGGANVGLHALTMAGVVGPMGSVTCFEPLPHIAEALQQTLWLNGFAHTTKVERLAISDRVGEATFNVAAHSPLSSLFELPTSAPAKPLRVPTMSLDSYVGGGRLDFVKLDIEGAEPRAWRGMQRVIAENEEIELVLEWSASHFARAGEDPGRFAKEIKAAGFGLYLVENASPVGQLTPIRDDILASLEAANVLVTRHGL